MKLVNFRIFILLVSFVCTTEVFAEYDKYLITSETVILSTTHPLNDYKIDTLCIVKQGEIVDGQISNEPGYLYVSTKFISSWGYIPSDCARIITQEEIDKIKTEKSDGIIHSLFKWYFIIYSLILVFIFVKYLLKNKSKPKPNFNFMNDKDSIILESKLEAFMESGKKNRYITKNIFRLISSIVFEVFVAYLLIYFSVSTEITLMILSICAIPMYFGLYRIFNVEQDLFSFSSKLENDFYGAMDFTFPPYKWFEIVPKKFDKKFSKWLLGLDGGDLVLSSGRIYYGYKKMTNSSYKDENIDKLIFDKIMSEYFNNEPDDDSEDEE